MPKTLSIVGGTYHEICIDPESRELYGSALRGAAALAEKGFNIELISCISKEDLLLANSLCSTFGINPKLSIIEETVTFLYYHPLSTPDAIGSVLESSEITLPDYSADYILHYGMIEAGSAVHGKYVVYDPQNHISFKETGSTAKHLAIVLNKKEAYLLSKASEDVSINEIGRLLLSSQQADVVVIKNGSKGAIVIDKDTITEIPVYKTTSVWPIGSGDIFSAVFSWQWAINQVPAHEAAMLASQYTAGYCQTRLLPVPSTPETLEAIVKRQNSKLIYLAAPFFTMGQRWLLNESREILLDFDNKVYSRYHDMQGDKINNELRALQLADIVLALVSDPDQETINDINEAKAMGKELILFSENIENPNLIHMSGTNCKIVSDFSTAIYMASW